MLAGAAWECAATAPGAAAAPDALAGLGLSWVPADVPGTVASAWAAAGRDLPATSVVDGADWWYRCAVDHHHGPGRAALVAAGLATVALPSWLR